MSEPTKARLITFTVVGTLAMMAVVGVAQYLVSSDGNLNAGVMVAVGVPSGYILGQNLAKGKKSA
jgi:hypothetical protein